MSDVIKKKICKCENCGNEAEMMITCSLPDEIAHAATHAADPRKSDEKSKQKVKGTATCSVCGNEADMWIDF